MCNVRNHIPRPFDASVVLPCECVGVEQLKFRHFFSLGQVMLIWGCIWLQSSLQGSINTKFHHSQRIHLKAVTGEVGGAQSGTWCWIEIPSSTDWHSNGSRLFSAGRPLGTRKNSVHCLWFLCCCTQTLHRTPFGTSSYFTHVDVCFGLLFTAL